MKRIGMLAGLCAAAFMTAAAPALPGTDWLCRTAWANQEAQDGQEEQAAVQPERFVLPRQAAVLVVAEGTGGSSCRVTAYERETGVWKKRLSVDGYLGKNGMSNHRVSGDRTTPIGLFCMDTPFGQEPFQEGFPANYIQVDESYMWEDGSNRLTRDLSQKGEQVGTAGYRGHYDYAINAGFNKAAVPNAGSALFLHCAVEGKTSTSGCVAIPKESMRTIMRLYGAYGDGRCFIAQAPQGTFDQIYQSYGVNNGLSPEGDFTN